MHAQFRIGNTLSYIHCENNEKRREKSGKNKLTEISENEISENEISENEISEMK